MSPSNLTSMWQLSSSLGMMTTLGMPDTMQRRSRRKDPKNGTTGHPSMLRARTTASRYSHAGCDVSSASLRRWNCVSFASDSDSQNGRSFF